MENVVRSAIDERKKQKLIVNCTTTKQQGVKINTKTNHIHTALTTLPYKREPLKEAVSREKQRTKTIILARSGMLECGKNFKGTMRESCLECNKLDDEEHRMNYCGKWEATNNIGKTTIDFTNIYSSDDIVLDGVISAIECVWELKYANGRMRRV